MMRLGALALALMVGGCTTYADPSTIRAPQTPQEWAEYSATSQQLVPIINRLADSNQDLCATQCLLNLRIGVSAGIGAFGGNGAVWMPIPMAREMQNDNERALILGHEWAHVLLQDPGGFDAGRELRADCLGAMLAKRAGYDPAAGAGIFRRWAGREAVEQVLFLAVGMVGGNAKQSWAARFEMIERANATDASKSAIETICGVRW
jgi:hypothetical protein